MKLQTTVDIKDFNEKIDYGSSIFMLGSCFTANIGRELEKRKFNVAYNPLGTIYNPQSVVDTIEIIARGREISEEELFLHNGVYGSFISNTLLTSTDKNETLNSINSAIKSAHIKLKEAKFVIITLGTSHCYYLKSSGKAVANCHKFPASDFSLKMLDHNVTEELFASLLNSEALIGKRLIFTVSPVRYAKYGFDQNSVSKAHLLIAINNLSQKFDNMEYFPSYEIFNDELRDYRYYADDMLHPSSLAIEYVWQRFSEKLITLDSQQLSTKIEDITRRISHRPTNPKSQPHQKFLLSTLKLIEAIEVENKNIDLNNEREYILSQVDNNI